jgi:hypothetical protein
MYPEFGHRKRLFDRGIPQLLPQYRTNHLCQLEGGPHDLVQKERVRKVPPQKTSSNRDERNNDPTIGKEDIALQQVLTQRKLQRPNCGNTF